MNQELWSRFFRDFSGNDSEVNLKSLDIFSDLNNREIKILEKYVYSRKYKVGEVIIKEGAPSVCIYIIVKGNAKVYKSLHNKRIDLAQIGKGALFGELAFLGNKQRSATVETISDTEVVCFYREDILNIILKYPELGLKILPKFLDIISDRFLSTLKEIEPVKLEDHKGKKDTKKV